MYMVSERYVSVEWRSVVEFRKLWSEEKQLAVGVGRETRRVARRGIASSMISGSGGIASGERRGQVSAVRVRSWVVRLEVMAVLAVMSLTDR